MISKREGLCWCRLPSARTAPSLSAHTYISNLLLISVNDKHQFKKGDLLYRFRYDDGTYRPKYDSSELSARVSV